MKTGDYVESIQEIQACYDIPVESNENELVTNQTLKPITDTPTR